MYKVQIENVSNIDFSILSLNFLYVFEYKSFTIDTKAITDKAKCVM